LALAARPKIAFDQHGNARLQWVEDFATMDAVVGLLALCLPSELVSAFQLAESDEPESANSVTPEERERKLAELSAVLLATERKEAALLDGVEIMLRPEMNPLAYLGVAIVAAAEAPAAA
jgi:hypothetical protein